MGCQWFPGSMTISVWQGVFTDMLVGDTDGSHRQFVLRGSCSFVGIKTLLIH